jgi:RimJ/RimL family protein N-acetyltransferase
MFLSGLSVAQIRDKIGRVFEVLPWEKQEPARLRIFYEEFEPKGEYQGIPPAQKRPRYSWIKGLLANWHNFLILEGDRVIGHVAISPVEGSLQELIIFLNQDYRGQGIGSEALGAIQGWLKQKGFGRLWLTVQNTNMTAIRCFRKVGFQFTSPPLEPEREMVLDLEESA